MRTSSAKLMKNFGDINNVAGDINNVAGDLPAWCEAILMVRNE
jgi:hypothetical protein